MRDRQHQFLTYMIFQRYRSSQPGLVEEASVGTTAEIYECREPSESGVEAGYHIKAKGRQRFKGNDSRFILTKYFFYSSNSL